MGEGLASHRSVFVGPLCLHAAKTGIMGTMPEHVEEFVEQDECSVIPPLTVEKCRVQVNDVDGQRSG